MKTVLGVAVVLYDIIFIVQHYCLYRNNDKKVLVDERYSQLTDTEGKEINAEDKTLNVWFINDINLAFCKNKTWKIFTVLK